MRKIITNTSPIIALFMIEKLPLLWELFDHVYVPEAVVKELTSSFDKNNIGRNEILLGIEEENEC